MQWTIDPAHSSVEFSVRHLGIATVRGRFTQISGSAELDERGRLQTIQATIDAASIDTGVAPRDTHLRSPDFFDVGRYPTITFRSTAITPGANHTLDVTGDLTMRGETHPVRFALESSAPIRDPWGNPRAAAAATGKLSRKTWGLTWNQVLELGGVAVADEIRFTLDIQAVAPAAVAA
jgi:polyisoprenoid-binding protein YceI